MKLLLIATVLLSIVNAHASNLTCEVQGIGSDKEESYGSVNVSDSFKEIKLFNYPDEWKWRAFGFRKSERTGVLKVRYYDQFGTESGDSFNEPIVHSELELELKRSMIGEDEIENMTLRVDGYAVICK